MQEIKEQDGIIMAIGSLPKERDPGEDAYMAAKTSPPPTAVNLNEPVSLLDYAPPEILNQEAVGACAQFTVAESDFITWNAARKRSGQSLNAKLAHPGYLYERARRKHGWFPRDSGSTVSDGFDILLSDKPLMERAPYVNDAAYDYDDAAFQNKVPIDDLRSHRPFFVSEGNALQQVKSMLDQGWAVAVSMHWANEYYNPPNGVLPEGVNWNPNIGHAMTLRGRTPDHGGLSAVINHWTNRWNPAVVNLGFDFRPGEVAIPDSFFMSGRNSPIFELRAASNEQVPIDPLPEPQPHPEPTGDPEITWLKVKAGGGKLVVEGKNISWSAQLVVDGVPRRTVCLGEGFLVAKKMALLPGRHEVCAVNPNGKSSLVQLFNVLQEQ